MAVTYNLYSVRDRKSSFMDPVPLVSDGLAIRNFVEFLRNVKDSDFGDFQVPYTDLELYRLGSFDLISGVIGPEMPSLLATASILDDFDHGGVSLEE